MKRKFIVVISLLCVMSYLCAEQVYLRNLKYDGSEDYRWHTSDVVNVVDGDRHLSTGGEMQMLKNEVFGSPLLVKVDSAFMIKEYVLDTKSNLVEIFKKLCIECLNGTGWKIK